MSAANGHRLTDAEVAAAREALPAAWAAVPGFEVTRDDDPVTGSERALLGSVIQSAAAAREAAALVESRHFTTPAHQLVWEAVMRLDAAGDPVEPAAVAAEMARAGTLARVGAKGMGTGAAYLHDLMQRAGSIGYHARVLREDTARRDLKVAIARCWQTANAEEFDLDEHLDVIRKRIEDATALTGTSSLRPNSETVTEVLDALEHGTDPGLSTGFPDLDDAIGGLRPKEVIVVGGRPGQGKTLLGLCIADHVGTNLGLPVLFASLEMSEAELTLRRIAAEARVPLVNLVRRQVAPADWDRISRTMDRLSNTGLHIDDTSQASAAHIRRQLRAMARTGKPARLLVIDYLGYMAAAKAESRQQAVAENVRQVEKIADEFGIPVILLAQLNRGPETRADKRPVPADLRETGEAEQTADIAILIHREDAYEPESARAGEVDLIVAKNRQGPQCTVTLAFQGHYGRVVSLGREWSPSSAIGDNR